MTLVNSELALRQALEARERLNADPSAPRYKRRLLERRMQYWLGVIDHANARASATHTQDLSPADDERR